MLQAFKADSNLKVRSKLKYIKKFQRLLSYLLSDIESPERGSNETPEERSAKAVTLKDIDREIECAYSQIEKKKGEDLAMCKRRAEETLMTDEEMETVLYERSNALKEIIDQDFVNFDKHKITEIRNDLMLVAAIRLGRRSTELVTMTCEEVGRAEERSINDEPHYIVKVFEQKNIKTGNEAPLAYSEGEFKVLRKYIEILRPKLNLNKNCISVFTTINKKINNKLSVASAFNILTNFETSSGKKMGSRAIRKSKITNSRYLNLSDQQVKDRATSMSHTVSTAERYYNHKALSDSVVSALSQSTSESAIPDPTSTSTPKKKCDLDQANEKNCTPLAKKRKCDLDETIKTLRSKKIKRCRSK